MDAARISDVRENVKADGWMTAAEALDLLDALEQAQKHIREDSDQSDHYEDLIRGVEVERDAAQKDAKDARALLGESDVWHEAALGLVNGDGPPDWDELREFRAVIDAELRKP